MPRVLLLLGILLSVLWPLRGEAQRSITPSEVFAEAVRLEKEVALLKTHFGLSEVRPAAVVSAHLLPRHPWQKMYIIHSKINLFRRQNGFPVQAVQSMQPVLAMEPLLVYEQSQRLLTEMQLLKMRLGIEETVAAQEVIPGKQPIDVFNKLHFVSVQWDVILRAATHLNPLYAEAKRIDVDVDTLLNALHISDLAYPPAKKSAVTADELLESSFLIMAEVQRLQQLAKLPKIDFESFRHPAEVSGADVWNMMGFILAELQTVKASVGLLQQLTPVAEYTEEKNPAAVLQLMGYVTHKLRLIRSL
ncbi:MAG: hypothetical protein HQM04_00250 [Magnetococcales bacterium]|nr:hypothetical protein [Magnetococcales bacterium]MBF0113452.1 hypothetical protein [Magnetococcales bacterium]